MKDDTGHDSRDDTTRQRVYRLVLAALTGVITVVFALSFYGLRDYGQHLAGLPSTLAWLVPVGLDILSLCALAAAYLLRHAPWHVRAYAWGVFGVPTALSIAGNLAHGDLRNLSPEGMVGAAAWPVVLALAAHLVVVVRRWMDRHDDTPPDTPPTAATRPGPLTWAIWHPDTGHDTDPDTTPDTTTAPRDQARRLRRAGGTHAEIADQLGASTRTVQRWTEGIKPRATRGRQVRRTDGADRTRLNGSGATPNGQHDTDHDTATADA